MNVLSSPDEQEADRPRCRPGLRPEKPIYAWAAVEYFYSGVGAPLPLPPRKKSPPPRHYTGFMVDDVTRSKVRQWSRQRRPTSNLALRLARKVLGIDVDDYANKHGAATIRRLEELYGPLPATVRSSSRHDGISGIYLFQIPDGLGLRARELSAVHVDGSMTGDVEVVWTHCRYMSCWPSRHPDRPWPRYRWFGLDGQRLQRIPVLEDLATLPEPWLPLLEQQQDQQRVPAKRRNRKKVAMSQTREPRQQREIRSALSAAGAAVRNAPEGSRNKILNRQAYLLAGHTDITDDEI